MKEVIIILILLLSLFFKQSQCDMVASITVSNSETGEKSITYKIQLSISRSENIPIGSTIIVQFENQYTNSLSNNPLCSSDQLPSITCSFTSSNLNIQGGFTTASNPSSISINIPSVTNPIPAKDYSFVVKIRDSLSTQLQSANTIHTIIPAKATCSMSLINGFVGNTNGILNITYNSKIIQILSTNSNYFISFQTSHHYPPNNKIDIAASISGFTYITQYLFQIPFINNLLVSIVMPSSDTNITDFIKLSTQLRIGTTTFRQIDSCNLNLEGVQPAPFKILTIPSKTVQTVSTMQFTILTTADIEPTDKISIKFDPAFDLSNLQDTAYFTQGVINQVSLTKQLNEVKIKMNFIGSTLSNIQIVFILRNITYPLSTKEAPITVSIKTLQNANRDQQIVPYMANKGILQNLQIICLLYEIGYTTKCTYTIPLTNKIFLTSDIKFVFPNGYNIISGNNMCPTSGSNTLTTGNCIFYRDNKTVLANSFQTSMIQPTSITNSSLTVQISNQLPTNPGQYLITIQTQQGGFIIDQGQAKIQIIKRKLLQNQANLTSTTNTTFTSTTYTLSLQLQPSLSIGYSLHLYMPFSRNSNPSITISTATTSSVTYQTGSKILTITNITYSSLTIDGFMSADSLEPVTVSGNLTHNSITYFEFTINHIITIPKTIESRSLQSSFLVYQIIQLTLTISQLQIGNYIILTNTQYTDFYPIQQPNCSKTIINCFSTPTFQVLNISNTSTNETQLNFNLLTQNYIGSVVFQLQILDSNNAFQRRVSSFTLVTSIANTMVSISIPENEKYILFYSQISTYTFTIVMHTPGASQLKITVPSTYAVNKLQAIVGCSVLTGLTLTITSLNITFKMTLRNPSSFINPITFVSSSSKGEIDHGQFLPQHFCTLPCRSCFVNNTKYCLTCYSGSNSNLINQTDGTCVSACNIGYFHNTNPQSCKACDSKCTHCSQITTNCTSCIQSFVLNQFSCLQSCPLGLFNNSNQCAICQINCINCSSKAICFECNNVTVLQNSICLNNCSTGNYNLNGICIACKNHCITCNSKNGSCIRCQNTFFQFQGNCYDTCPNGVYKSSNGCETCQQPCLTCEQWSQNCTSCILISNTTNYFLLNNDCVTDKCPTGYYISPSTNQCLSCNSTCLSCTSNNNCQNCITGYILITGSCLSSCPLGTYLNLTNCLDCPLNCTTCESDTLCTNCILPLVLLEGVCQSSCTSSYHTDGNRHCIPCSVPCKKCNDTGCLSCIDPDMYLSTQQCLLQCLAPLHPNSILRICEICQQPCETCLASAQCLSCIDNYIFFNETCVKTCPETYYNLTSLCQKCPQLCLTCIYRRDEVQCISCQSNASLYGYQCVQQCPNSTTLSSLYCQSDSCQGLQYCFVCSNLRCLKCSALFELNDDGNCLQIVGNSAIISSISQIPVPFPFLIATLVFIIVSFILRITFTKMYTPLFIYSFAGIAQVGSFMLWTYLSYIYAVSLDLNWLHISRLPFIICAVYFILNITNLSLWIFIIRNDNRYNGWQMQGNKISSWLIGVLSGLLSFRFGLLVYSQLGHLQSFSANLSKQSKYRHYNILAIVGIILICLPSLVVSGFICYLQISLNHLFFTCLEIAIISVIMMIITLTKLLTPKGYVLQKKGDYQHGYDSEHLEGKSIQELMLGMEIVQQQYHQGNIVINDVQEDENKEQQDLNFSIQNSQKQSQQIVIPKMQFSQEQNTSKQQKLQFYNEQQLDENYKDEQQIEQLNEIYLTDDSNLNNKIFRTIGSIKKQIVNEIKSQESDDIYDIEEMEEQENNQIKLKQEIPDTIEIEKKLFQQHIKAKQIQEREQQMQKIHNMLSEISNQKKQQIELKNKLNQLENNQLNRQLVERNMMTREDKVSKLAEMFHQRNMKQLEKKRNLGRTNRKISNNIKMKQLAYEPIEQHEQIPTIKIQVKQNKQKKEEKKKRQDKIINEKKKKNKQIIKKQIQNKQKKIKKQDINFNNKIQEKVSIRQKVFDKSIQKQYNQKSNKIYIQQPNLTQINNQNFSNEIINNEMQERLKAVQQKAQMYISEPRRKNISVNHNQYNKDFEQFKDNLNNWDDQDPSEFTDVQIDENQIENNIIATKKRTLSVTQAKLPKGRINRKVINLSPNHNL